MDSGPLTQVFSRPAQKYGKTESQILLRWDTETGVVAITRSWNQERIEEAIGAASFELAPDDTAEISSKGRGFHFRRHVNPFVGKDDLE